MDGKTSLSKAKDMPDTTENLPSDIKFPDWYVSISFGKSTSKNYPQAVELAKMAPQYIPNNVDGKIIHQAVYSKKAEDYLNFIKLYELVSNWKSCFVVINGNIVDRKVIGKLNYCYGDKCRSGKSDFCYGASQFTANPFGCHRAQMHAYNDPWYSFGIIDSNGVFHVDKDSIKNELLSRLEPYKLCPAININTVIQNVDKLPNIIDPRVNENWEYTTIMKNGIPIDGVQPTLEARGLVYKVKLNIEPESKTVEKEPKTDFTDRAETSSHIGDSNTLYMDLNKKDENSVDKKRGVKSNKKRSFLHILLGIIISLVICPFIAALPILTINNAFLGIIITLASIYLSFKLGFLLADKIFFKNRPK